MCLLIISLQKFEECIDCFHRKIIYYRDYLFLVLFLLFVYNDFFADVEIPFGDDAPCLNSTCYLVFPFIPNWQASGKTAYGNMVYIPMILLLRVSASHI